jgi:hypothetical protein
MTFKYAYRNKDHGIGIVTASSNTTAVLAPGLDTLWLQQSHNCEASHSSSSRWLLTAAARLRARVVSCGIGGGRSGARAGFLRVLLFPLPILIPPIAPQLT